MSLTTYDASAIAIHRMSAATKTGEYQVYLAADVEALLDDPQALAALLVERAVKSAQP